MGGEGRRMLEELGMGNHKNIMYKNIFNKIKIEKGSINTEKF